MSQTIMYQAKANSPKTTLPAQIAAGATTINVADTNVFPPAPNLATVGGGNTAEVISYAGIGTGTLTGCARGIGGTTASVWPSGTSIGRYYTDYDHNTFISNIEDLDTHKLAKTGAADNATVTFTAATSRSNVSTGEKISVLLGKLAKWYTDFKGLAWKDSVGTTEINAAAVTNAKLANMAAKTLKGNATAGAAAPTDISAADALTLLGAAESKHKHAAADITDFPSSLAPTAHRSTHATKGADAITPADIGAAAAAHKHAAADITDFPTSLAPTAHKATHKTGGTDAITPADIGAAEEISFDTATGDTITLVHGHMYTRTGAVAVTIVYPAGDYIAEVVLTFAAAGAFSVTFPTGTIYLGKIPTWAAGKTYEINVSNGIAVCAEAGAGI